MDEDRSELERRILEVVARALDADPAEMPPERSFAKLGLDSLDAYDVLFAVEEEFEIDIPDDEARSIDSLDRLVDVVERRLAG